MVVAMIAIDMQTVGTWAEKRGLAYTSFMDLSRKPEVAALIGEEIAKANATLPDVQQVKRFLLLNKELEADDAEMTRTRKVRRRFVAEKYAAVIDGFYGGATDVAGDDGDHLRGRPQVVAHHRTSPSTTWRAPSRCGRRPRWRRISASSSR